MNAYGDTSASYDPDQQHLLLLRIFHYVFAGMQCLYGLVLLLQLLIFNSMYRTMTSRAFEDLNSGPHPVNITPPSPPFSVISMLIVVMLLLTGAMIICNLIAAHSLAVRRNHTFCLVISGINCIIFPIGTALGVFTIVVLLRPSVKRLFDQFGY